MLSSLRDTVSRVEDSELPPALRRLCRAFSFAGLVFIVMVLAACGRMQPAAPGPSDGYSVTMTSKPSAPSVGPGLLIFTLHDPSGRPAEGATATVEGNMSHAGMIPVTGVMQSASGGEYRVDLEWTMAGDWFVDVAFDLPGGAKIARRFPIAVQ